jgi:hypothetical protein
MDLQQELEELEVKAILWKLLKSRSITIKNVVSMPPSSAEITTL